MKNYFPNIKGDAFGGITAGIVALAIAFGVSSGLGPTAGLNGAIFIRLHDIFIKHIKDPLFFGSTSNFQVLSLQIPETAKTVIMRLGIMQYMDQSGLYAMEDMLLDLKSKEVEVLFVGLQEQPKYMMERIDIIPDFIPREHIFDHFDDCVEWIKENVEDKY